MYNCYNFKHASVDLGSMSVFDGEWLFMLDDAKGTVVPIWCLFIEDNEDEQVAKSFGLDEMTIDHLKEWIK